MKSIIGTILANVGAGLANVGTNGCIVLMLDEPKMPKSLIK